MKAKTWIASAAAALALTACAAGPPAPKNVLGGWQAQDRQLEAPDRIIFLPDNQFCLSMQTAFKAGSSGQVKMAGTYRLEGQTLIVRAGVVKAEGFTAGENRSLMERFWTKEQSWTFLGGQDALTLQGALGQARYRPAAHNGCRQDGPRE